MTIERVPATTSAWEFEQQRDVGRVIAQARAATDGFAGRPAVVLGELDWTERVDNVGLDFRTIRAPVLELEDDDDELDGYWEWE